MIESMIECFSNLIVVYFAGSLFNRFETFEINEKSIDE